MYTALWHVGGCFERSSQYITRKLYHRRHASVGVAGGFFVGFHSIQLLLLAPTHTLRSKPCPRAIDTLTHRSIKAFCFVQQARALFRDEDLPPEDAQSLSLPALLARVRAVASERRFRQTRLEAELATALRSLEGVRGVEGKSRREEERLRAEAAEASARWGSGR